MGGTFAAYEGEWKHEPITIDFIDTDSVASLAENPSEKLRLFNVWALSSLPSVDKMREFAKLAQRLDRRDIEIITISLDPRSAQEKVLKFLQEQHVGMPTRIKDSIEKEGRTSNNYIFTGKGAVALAKALDPEWPGAPLPHTVLIAPGGEVLWRYTGAGFDPIPLGRIILDELGGYFPQE